MTNAIEEKPDASLHDGGSQDLLKAALVIIAVGVVLYSVVLHLVAPEQSYRLVAPLLLPPIILLITLIMLRRGRVQAALRMLAFGVWAVVTIAASFAGGLRAPALVTFPLLIVMAGWLLGLRSGVVMAVLTLSARASVRAGGICRCPAAGAAGSGPAGMGRAGTHLRHGKVVATPKIKSSEGIKLTEKRMEALSTITGAQGNVRLLDLEDQHGIALGTRVILHFSNLLKETQYILILISDQYINLKSHNGILFFIPSGISSIA